MLLSERLETEKILDKIKTIHALKQPENLLSLLAKLTVQNQISERHGLYHYKCKRYKHNLCKLCIQNC